MQQLSPKQVGIVKKALFIGLAIPSIYALVRVLSGDVVEPADYLTHLTGELALRLLIVTLFITPLIRISNWYWLIKLRRMLGLYAFYYALLHFLVYLLLDLQLDLSIVWEDITKRTYITIGFSAFLLLIPLAVTSNDILLKKMGARRWQRIHRAIYLIVPLTIVHFWWQIKNEAIAEPLIYAVITVILLAMRHPWLMKKIKRR